MFTGLIETIGSVTGLKVLKGGLRLTVTTPKTLKLRLGDSIAVDGCCQTVVECSKNAFSVIAVEETLKKTNFSKLSKGSCVNIERPMAAKERFGGHFVLGHIDCVTKVVKIEKKDSSRMFWFDVPAEYSRLLIPVGSVAVNGVSLTVARLKKDSFGVSIIPHTFDHTTFQHIRKGDNVNLEFDVIGKYVQRLMDANKKG
ncbi:MAG TPA: riboflavin synthase [Candidatus Kapabacteria bacterium]|nr:riboflavin synthase [Candidatus Kapabacteria bacterium]